MLFAELDTTGQGAIDLAAFAAGVEKYSSVIERQKRAAAAAQQQEVRAQEERGLRFMSIAGSADTLHKSHPDSVHMVASQFNCLEMVGPGERPPNPHPDPNSNCNHPVAQA